MNTLLEQQGTRAEYVLLDMGKDLDRVAIKPYPKVVAALPSPAPAAGYVGTFE